MTDKPEQRPCPHCGAMLTVSEDHLAITRRYDDDVWYACRFCGREAVKASYAATRSTMWDGREACHCGPNTAQRGPERVWGNG